MKNSFLKGLIMGIVGLLASTISDMETLNIAYIVITTVGFTLSYLLKNWLYPNMSEKFTVQASDFINGAIIACLMGLSNYSATLLTGIAFTWPAFVKAVGIAVGGYFFKTIPSNKGTLITK